MPELEDLNLFSETATPVALLTQLMLAGSRFDFSLRNFSDEGQEPRNFKRLRYPESFKACLVQIANESWNSFTTSNAKMDQIRLQMDGLPHHLRRSHQILTNRNDTDITKLLPTELEKVKTAIQSSKQLSLEAEEKFQLMLETLCELLEAITAFDTETFKRTIAKAKQFSAASMSAHAEETSTNMQKLKNLVNENSSLVQRMFEERKKSGIPETGIDDAIGKIENLQSQSLLDWLTSFRTEICQPNETLAEVLETFESLQDEKEKLDVEKCVLKKNDLLLCLTIVSKEIKRLKSISSQDADKLKGTLEFIQQLLKIHEVENDDDKNRMNLSKRLIDQLEFMLEFRQRRSQVAVSADAEYDEQLIVFCPLDEVQFVDIKIAVAGSIQAILQMIENWRKFGRLLARLENIIGVACEENLRHFTESALKSEEGKTPVLSLHALFKKDLLSQLALVTKAVYFSLQVTSGYCLISDNFLSFRASRLHQILLLDKDRDLEEMKNVQAKVLEESQKAVDDMRQHKVDFMSVHIDDIENIYSSA